MVPPAGSPAQGAWGRLNEVLDPRVRRAGGFFDLHGQCQNPIGIDDFLFVRHDWSSRAQRLQETCQSLQAPSRLDSNFYIVPYRWGVINRVSYYQYYSVCNFCVAYKTPPYCLVGGWEATSSFCPDGVRVRVAQVKRESPGRRVTITKSTTRR